MRWDANGQATELARPVGDTETLAYGIDNRGDIAGGGVGGLYDPSQVLEWDPSGQVRVVTTDPFEVKGSAINDLGVIVGDNQRQATAWYPGGRTVALRSPYPGRDDFIYASAVNDLGFAVGRDIHQAEIPVRWSPDGNATVLPGLGLPVTCRAGRSAGEHAVPATASAQVLD